MPTDDEPTLPGPDGLPTRDSAPSGDADGDRPTIDTPATTPGSTPARGGGGLARAPLPALPGYTVTQLIGEGGMGAVYEAQQHKPARRVALKLIRPGAITPHTLKRFEHEQEVLARLQHPGIAAIHEAGLHHGTPFFAMEFIDGPTLTEYANTHQLGTRDRLALLAQVCDAVHHAHTKGVIHRDLKPANILVTQFGDPPRAQPKVLDFGIARATDSDILATTMHTDVGQVVGTLPYMSPEQVAGDNEDIDTRSDVYALGVVLYELLAGQLPYDLKQRLIHEAARVIREEQPTRLSGVNTKYRGDIETIVGMAMEKERDRRYPSASDLGSDIRRYLSDEPITARPPSQAYLVKKFAQRHKGLVAGVAATFAVLVAGIVATSIFAVRADAARADAVDAQIETEQARQAEADERQRAEDNADRARANAAEAVARAEEADAIYDYLVDQFSAADPNQPGALHRTIRDVLLAQDVESILARFTGTPRVQAKLLHRIGTLLISVSEPNRAMPFLRRALALYRADPGVDAGELATMLHVYHSGNFGIGSESEETARQWAAWLEESIAIRRRLGGPQSGLAAQTEIDLAYLTRNEPVPGRVPVNENPQYLMVAGAIAMLEGGLRSDQEVLDALYLAVLETELAWGAGQEAQARQIVRDTVSVFIEQPGWGPMAGKGLATLAVDLQSQGFTNAAIATMVTALEIEQEIGGDQSLDYYRVLSFAGRLSVMQHDYDLGFSRAQSAYEVFQTRAADDHSAIDWVQQDLFLAAMSRGDLAFCEGLRREWEAAGDWERFYEGELANRAIIEGHDRAFDWFASRPMRLGFRDGLTGFTPVHYASLHGRGGYLRRLIEAGADVNLQSPEGATPLHLAADQATYDQLVAAGADPDATDAEGRAPARP